MWAKDVMEKPVFVSPTTKKKELLALAKKYPHTNLFVVVDKKAKFLGDISEEDLFFMLLPNDIYDDIGVQLAFDLEKKFFAKTAREVMHAHDVSCQEDDDVMEVALRLSREEVNAMPVLDGKGRVVGVIKQGTLLRRMKL